MKPIAPVTTPCSRGLFFLNTFCPVFWGEAAYLLCHYD